MTSDRRGGLTVDRLPTTRPAYLRTSTWTLQQCWRIDAAEPAGWEWTPFPTPRYRFDSAAGTARVRYAGLTARGAARERWDPDRFIAAADADSWLVQLAGTVKVLDLRRESVLDRLGLDDRINTARDAETWSACQVLGDRLRDWLPQLDAIVYRSRTTPETSANIAWHRPGALRVVRSARLRDQPELVDRLVIADGFTVDFDW